MCIVMHSTLHYRSLLMLWMKLLVLLMMVIHSISTADRLATRNESKAKPRQHHCRQPSHRSGPSDTAEQAVSISFFEFIGSKDFAYGSKPASLNG
jgi:hypothetical protein